MPTSKESLMVFALYGEKTINLGLLSYVDTMKIYQRSFERIVDPPDSITIIGTGGGSDTFQFEEEPAALPVASYTQ